MRILAIDDVRDFSFTDVLCRTYEEGVKALAYNGPWDELYLDHDLGAVKRSYDDSGREQTGYTIACFLEQHPSLAPNKIIIVTSNPVGLKNISDALSKIMKKVDSRTWEKYK